MEVSQLPEKSLFTCTVKCLPNTLLCYLRHHLAHVFIGHVGCSFIKWPRTVQGTTTLTQSYRPRQPTTNKVDLHYWIRQLSFIARNDLKWSPDGEKRAQRLCCCSFLFLPIALTLATSFPGVWDCRRALPTWLGSDLKMSVRGRLDHCFGPVVWQHTVAETHGRAKFLTWWPG